MNASTDASTTKVLEHFFSDRLAGEEFVVCLPELYAQVPDEPPPEVPDDVPPELPRGEPTEDPELPQPQDCMAC